MCYVSSVLLGIVHLFVDLAFAKIEFFLHLHVTDTAACSQDDIAVILEDPFGMSLTLPVAFTRFNARAFSQDDLGVIFDRLASSHVCIRLLLNWFGT